MKTYLDLHREFSAGIEAELADSLARAGKSAPAVRDAVDRLLRHQPMKYPLSVLPLLVHGAETGSAEPALPLSAVHVLWWTSACYLDDLADGQGAALPAGLGLHEALLAAIVTGHLLPLQVLESPAVPAAVRPALTAELLECGMTAAEGQMDDMRKNTGEAGRGTVLAAYRGKSGAPFAMITAMAAILSGARTERIRLWREFGDVFGILWQIFNDYEDLASGRHEDLLNGTVTYALACALEEASPGERQRILALHAGARTSDEARSDLAALLLGPSALAYCEKDLGEFRDTAYRLLDELGGDEAHVSVLRGLVDQTSRLRP
ncbi:polyprenyl synthetase family protein [Streptomyces sp. NPDC002573]|uniref:polyprenyl synthetase family protein n=1 Tax=Streptomyces sp. NPDC002573 TaxID=3364651 RepID=UPI00368305FE